VVVNCLGRQPRVPFGAQVALDLAGLDSVHRSVAEEGSQMAAQVATVVGDRRALALHHLLEVRDVGITRLADGPPLALGHHGRRVDEPAQLALGLRAREAIGIADAALRPDLALDRVLATHQEPVPAGAPAAVDDDVQPPGSVGALPTPQIVPAGWDAAERQIGTLLEPWTAARREIKRLDGVPTRDEGELRTHERPRKTGPFGRRRRCCHQRRRRIAGAGFEPATFGL